MIRTDLIALAERLKPMAQAPCFDGLDMAAMDAFLRQIAQAQPVAWTWGNHAQFVTQAAPNTWLSDRETASPLYTLPLED